MSVLFRKMRKYDGVSKMVLMNIAVDNFYGLNDFCMNMSYPRKIINSLLENEHLADRPNFRYKKMNIIMGANASGKTSIGRAMMAIFNFVKTQDHKQLTTAVGCVRDPASFTIEVAGDDFKLHRISAKILPMHEGQTEGSNITVSTSEVTIGAKDSYEKCRDKLNEVTDEYASDYHKQLEDLGRKFSWRFTYPYEDSKFTAEVIDDTDLEVLEVILRTFDPTIESVARMGEVSNAFAIKAKNWELVVHNGQIVDNTYLSSGTRASLTVALLISALKKNQNKFYFCDEKFSFAHTELEQAIICAMAFMLKENDQLFFTTHNRDLLELSFPMHAFNFIRKDLAEDGYRVRVLSAADYLKRNTDSLVNAAQNDLFSVNPEVSMLYKLLEETAGEK